MTTLPWVGGVATRRIGGSSVRRRHLRQRFRSVQELVLTLWLRSHAWVVGWVWRNCPCYDPVLQGTVPCELSGDGSSEVQQVARAKHDNACDAQS